MFNSTDSLKRIASGKDAVFAPALSAPSSKLQATTSYRGFTLIELLVSVSILAFITTTVLANHSRFNSSLLLGNLAYDVALSVRQAQVYGLSVRSYNSAFNIGYGVHFSSPTSYLFFADIDNDKRYTEAADAIIREYTLSQRYQVQRFCAALASGEEHCSDGEIPITYLDIVFVRPDPDAHIATSNTSAVYSGASVTVESPGNAERTVDIASTGQISVETQ
jgi:prepilin-type N-terminal cleavage/methylation domain-containing protein